MANIMMAAIPKAAMGVSMGSMFSNIGNMSPIAPAIFDPQIKYLMLLEYSFTHDKRLANFSFGNSIISKPESVNTVAKMPCIIQSIVFMFMVYFKFCEKARESITP